MNCNTITRGVLRIRPGAAFAVAGDTLDDIIWLDEVLTRPSDPAIQTSVAAIEAEDAAGATAAVRRKANADRGATTEAMVEALWRQVVDGDSTAADALAVIRGQVEDEFPEVQP
jgi:hypothetical protein